jgi:DNA-binding transcriptional regulator YhcF (GntR family)
VDAGTKADEIALALEEAIVSGELAPGSVLRQEQVSAQYAVSRTPVREALRRLAALGLVSFEANRGFRVRTLSRSEVYEAFLLRAELESLVTGIAAERITDEDLDELAEAERRFSRLTRAMREREPGADRRSLTVEWMRANHGFPRRHLPGGQPPLHRGGREVGTADVLGPAVWAPGDGSINELYLVNDASTRRSGSARRREPRGRPLARTRARPRLVPAARDDPRAGGPRFTDDPPARRRRAS